jgi:hypothetical protein
MEKKFTKGKWRQAFENKKAVLCETDEKILTICVTDIGNHIDQQEAIANAKLISKSPQLLETVIALQKRLELLINSTPSGDARNKMCNENILCLELIRSILE